MTHERDHDALFRLAETVRRPNASLAAFHGLSAEQLDLLTGAIERTIAQRRTQLDADLRRAIPGSVSALVLHLLRGPDPRQLLRERLGRQP